MATQFDLKSATPDTSFPSGAFLFGADSQSASDPSIYSSDAYLNYLVTVASAWSAAQTFTSAAPQLTLGVNATTLGSVKLFGNTSGDATLRPTAAAGTATVCTLPATTTTLAGLAVVQTFSAANTFTSAAPQLTLGVNATTLGSIKLFGSSSGDATLQPAAAAGTATVITFPSTTTTLAGLAVGQTFSAANTFTSAAPQLTLGVNTTTLGSIKMFGNTSGDVTLQPSAVAGTATTLTLPATTSTLAGLAIGQTFTATQTITPAANTNALAVTGYSVTGSGTTAMFDLAGTWNTSGVAFGLKLNLTDTASSALSGALETQYGGSTHFRAGKGASGYSCLWVLPGVTPSLSNFTIASTSGSVTFCAPTGSTVQIGDCGTTPLSVSASLVKVAGATSVTFGFTSNTSSDGLDTTLRRNAAAIMSLRGSTSTTPASFNFYTYATSPPSAPSASMALLYADTSGGKIRLMALFPSGAAQQIAIEP